MGNTKPWQCKIHGIAHKRIIYIKRQMDEFLNIKSVVSMFLNSSLNEQYGKNNYTLFINKDLRKRIIACTCLNEEYLSFQEKKASAINLINQR